MGPLEGFAVDVASAVIAAAVLAVLHALVKTARTVTKTAESAEQLAASVSVLQQHDTDTRERLAALEGPPWGRRRTAWSGDR